MTQFKKICAVIALAFTTGTAFAGGILTNTNQNISFLRNPAQDAAININGVYSNPAGVAFLGDGFHIGINWQAVKQTREVTSTNPLFANGAANDGKETLLFKGNAVAPVLPSLQAAYNTGKWSFQFNFAVTGGGGKCTFDNGLGSFEGAIATYGDKFRQLSGLRELSALGVPGVSDIPNATGYAANSYLQGRQYYFGFTLGAAYKINEHLSVYGGARILYGTAGYKARIGDINVVTPTGNMPLAQYVATVSGAMQQAGAFAADPANQTAMIAGLTQQLVSKGMLEDQATAQATQTVLGGLAQLNGAASELGSAGEALQPYLKDGINLQCDQSGLGIAPIIGVDYRIGNFNFAAKYEFKTRMRLKNKSTVEEASVIGAINKFQDGAKVAEDMPAMLAVGAEWNVIPTVRINAGYHYFWDKQSKKYGNEQDKLNGGTNEFLGGVEWDFAKKWTVSAGFQTTSYGLTDDYMNDMSFVVDSWSFGLGVKYQVNEKVALNAAYFQTNYDNYKSQTPDAYGTMNDYTRTSRVLGLGVELNF